MIQLALVLVLVGPWAQAADGTDASTATQTGAAEPVATEPPPVLLRDPGPSDRALRLADGLAYSERALAQRLSWPGDGKVGIGTRARPVSTLRFAQLTGDDETEDALERLRARLGPGVVLMKAGALIVVGSAVLAGGVLAVAIVGSFACLFGATDVCGDESVGWTLETLLYVSAGAAVTGGVLLGVGALATAAVASANAPSLQLLEWYTPEDVRARIDDYNRSLMDEDETAVLAPAPRRGSLDLGLTPTGIALVGRF